METLLALKTRRSIRSYRNEPVPRDLIEQVVDAGRHAASGNNVQPWEFVVVSDRPLREKLASLVPNGKHIASAPVCIAVLCADGKHYLEDGAAATQNMLVAAHALGLGACWIAGDRKPYADGVRKLLEAPATFKLVSLVTVGYPAEQPTVTKRPLTEVLHWDRF